MAVIKSLKLTAKSFRQIPTLKSYPVIGHSYLFLPGGKYSSEKLTEAIADISKTLDSSIFKLRLGGNEMLFTVDAASTQKLLRNEGVRPIRPPFPALYKCRKETFDSVGVVPGNGDEWHRLRSGVTPLLKSNVLIKYKKKQRDVADAFVSYIERNCDPNNYLNDIWNHLIKFAVEVTSSVCPGQRILCLTEQNKETEIITKASNDFMDGMYKTLIGLPLWKMYRTAAYKQLESSHQIIYDIIKDHLKKTENEYLENPDIVAEDHPFMHALFTNEKLSDNDRIMIAIEVFLGGLDTTATTSALTLHYLAKNKHIQAEAFREACTDDVNYFEACVRETLRMSPTAGAVSRFLPVDTVIGGYLIPKDTLVVAFTSVSSNNGEYFKNAHEYRPERWLRERREEYARFASLPFGHGARMCPGKRLATNEIIQLIKQIVLRYELATDDNEDIPMVFRMNRIPERPINIKFVDRIK